MRDCWRISVISCYTGLLVGSQRHPVVFMVECWDVGCLLMLWKVWSFLCMSEGFFFRLFPVFVLGSAFPVSLSWWKGFSFPKISSKKKKKSSLLEDGLLKCSWYSRSSEASISLSRRPEGNSMRNCFCKGSSFLLATCILVLAVGRLSSFRCVPKSEAKGRNQNSH